MALQVRLIVEFGKKKELKGINLIEVLAHLYGMSKAEVKRKWGEGAFSLYLVERMK